MTIHAFAALRAGAPLEPFDYDPPPLQPLEVEIAVSHCGLCHSDLSLLDDAWRKSRFPLVPGHEVVGRVVAVGEQVCDLSAGLRVGVGWQRSACLTCDTCAEGEEQLCRAIEETCVGHHGGLADRLRADSRFVFPLPDAIADADAAPLLCGGVTVMQPLLRHRIGPKSSVGVIGIGGLGHLALQFLRAIGCQVTAFSSSPDKRAEAISMGADEFASSTSPREVRRHARRFHLLISTANAPLDWITFMETLRPNGTLCLLGVPPGFITLPPAVLFMGQRSITASEIGPRAVVKETLRFAAAHRVRPAVESMPIGEINRAVVRLKENRARYRIVLHCRA
jgi:uncharacterized zinc-type alcohol dehydrogenase-like protein